LNNATDNDGQGTIGKKIISTYIYAFFTALIGFGIVVVFSWILPPEEWGAFSVAKRTGTLIATMALLGISVAVTRYIPIERAKQSHNTGDYRLNAVFIIFLSSLVITGLWVVGLVFIPRVFSLDEVLLLPLFAATLFIVSLMWQLLMSSFLRAEGLLQQYNQIVLGGQLLQLIVGLFAIYFLFENAFAAMLGSAVGVSCIVVVAAIMLVKARISIFQHSRLRGDIRKKLLSYGLPRMGMGLFEVLIVSLSLILLGFSGATVEAGLFAIAVQFIAMMKLLFQPITVVMLPEFSLIYGRADTNELRNKIQMLIKSWLYLITIIIIILFIFLDHFFIIFFKVEYIAAVPLTQILLLGMIPFSFYLISVSYLNAVYKRPYSLYFLIVGICVNITLFIILVPQWGASGAAVATCGGMITVGSFTASLLLKVQPKAFTRINFFSYGLCISPLVGIFIISMFTESLYLLIIAGLIGVGMCLICFRIKEGEMYSLVTKNSLKKLM